MKLFIYCDNCSEKIYLKAEAKTKRELATKIGEHFNIVCPNCKNRQKFHVNEVEAESESSNAIGGAILGGVLGLIGGPIGALSGSTIGGALGYGSDENDRKAVKRFNNSGV